MRITSLRPVNRARTELYLEEEYVGWLRPGEVKDWNLREGEEVSPKTWEELQEKAIFLHAREKAMDLLVRMDQTEEGLRRKLLKAGFTKEAVEAGMSYVISYGYIDDARYARNFISCYEDRMTGLMLRQKLAQRGIASEVIGQALEERKVGEEELLQDAIKKQLKGRRPEELDRKEREKVVQHLLRKGFSFSQLHFLLED